MEKLYSFSLNEKAFIYFHSMEINSDRKTKIPLQASSEATLFHEFIIYKSN
jgi:hypothetical protein